MAIPWNKGLSVNSDERVKRYGRKISKSLTGKPKRKMSEEQKHKISISMKKAQKEGRAWNIGKSRWNNIPSYAENFFIKVIENEFTDKNYKREFNVGRYSIDFAWPHKKLAIEIDGKQHNEDIQCKNRDIKKDIFLQENGWKVLRIFWKNMYNNTQECINQSKTFVDESTIISVSNLFLTNKQREIYEKTQNRYIELNKKINLIKNSNIDFSKFGWVNDTAILLNMKSQHVNKWMKRHMLVFYNEKCFKRICIKRGHKGSSPFGGTPISNI